MRKIVILGLSMIAGLTLMAQKAEKIYSFARMMKPHSYYVQQADLWWKTIEKDKSNDEAWYNYYYANRYAKSTFGEYFGHDESKKVGWKNEGTALREESDIFKLIEKNVPNSFAYFALYGVGYPDNPKIAEYRQKAIDLRPDHSELIDGIVVNLEIAGNMAKRKEYNARLFRSNSISPALLAYSYNVLMSVQQGGVILAFMDNDTFPIWLLQDVHNIRPDVTLLNTPLLCIKAYRQRMFSKLGIPDLSVDETKGDSSVNIDIVITHIIKNKPEAMPLYVGLPAWKQLKNFENNLYLEGVVLEYSNHSVDNIARMQNNFENKYALDYLKTNFLYDISENVIDNINVNYLPGIFKLYEHYNTSGETIKATKMKELGMLIAQKGGSDWVQTANEVFKK